MTDILCKWLNEEVKLIERIDAANFTHAFSSGYLLGELMSKFGLQEDFKSFSPGSNTDAKLNNFSRLEPSLRLLQVPFNSNVVADIMREKAGSVTKLMYQLFIALNRKEQQNLTSHAMEAMKSSQKMTLENANAEFYQNRLRQQFPRQVEVDIEELVKKFNKKRLVNLEKALKAEKKDDEEYYENLQALRQQKMEKSRLIIAEQKALMNKLGTSPKPRTKVFDQKVKDTLERKKTQRKDQLVQDTFASLDEFEEKQQGVTVPTGTVMTDFSAYVRGEGSVKNTQFSLHDNRATIMKPEQNAEYISKIRMRLCDDSLARKEREKRRRRVLVEQLAAHEAIEQSKHEEMLVTCLMRQSQQERRIALQLLQVRQEKDVIRNNRQQREQQYMQRRLKDFDEALQHEAEMAQMAKKDYQEQFEKELARHESIARDNATAKYQKHYELCKEVVLKMVDFSAKAGHYKMLSEQALPAQMWREWKAMFVAGKPFYPAHVESPEGLQEDSEVVAILNEANLTEYKELTGEWTPQVEHPEISPYLPAENNFILGHILKRVMDIVYPPSKPPTPPQFPEFPIKACILGKTFAGKTSVLAALSAKKRLTVIDVDALVSEAVQAYNDKETIEVTEVIEVESKAEEPPLTEEVEAPSAELPKSPSVAVEAPSPGPHLETVFRTEATPRAALGKVIEQAMSKGKPIPTQTLVDIVVYAIRQVPEGTGWVLDGFPKTLKQARSLEKALSGFVVSESRASLLSSAPSTPAAPSPRTTPSPAKGKNGKKKKNVLIEEPEKDKATPPPPPVSGIDVIINLNIPDKAAIRRACGRRKHKNGEEYHEENRPPPEGSYTGIPPTYEEFNVKHRKKTISPSLEDYLKACITEEEEGVQEIGDERSTSPTSYLTLLPPQVYDMPSHPSPDLEFVEDDPYKQIQSRLVTFQDEWSRMEKWFSLFNNMVTVDSLNSLSEVEERVEDLLDGVLAKKLAVPSTPERLETPAKTPTKTPASEVPDELPVEDEGDTPTKTPAAEEPEAGVEAEVAPVSEGGCETIPEEPSSPYPAPGSDEWEYVDEVIPPDAANILCPQWELVQNSYLQLCKHTFKEVRSEREIIIRYFYQTKKNFVIFLQRPDNKQTFVTNWVQDYNNVAEDMREDDEMKDELHQTVEDLKEKLWDISDRKKIEAEEERQSIMTEQWLEDHMGLLTNHYIQFMQAEVDRFQGSMRLLHDYYQVIEGKILDEPKKEFTRVPLVELPRTDTPLPPVEEKNERGSAKSGSDRGRSASKMNASPSGQTPVIPPMESEDSTEQEPQRRIPLVSRKTLESRESRKSGRRETPDEDAEEAQIMEAYQTALMVIEQLKQPAADDAGDDKGKGAKGKDKGKGKKGKKSASPAVTPTAGTPVPELSPEELAKQKTLERANLECSAALLAEEKSLNLKLALIKIRAITVIKELKERAGCMYNQQQEWIGERFNKEMESITKMGEMMCDIIESEKPLLHQVLLTDDQLIVDSTYKMFEPPQPPAPDEPIEQPQPDVFTVSQVQQLFKSLREIAPSKYISLDTLVEMFEPPAYLPDIWSHVTKQQLEEIFSHHLCESKYINWSSVVISAILPLPLPSQAQLISSYNQFKSVDKNNTGRVNMSGFTQGDLWFSSESVGPDGGPQYDRLGHLKVAIFTFFCDENYDLDYTNLLLQFCADPEPGEGLLKALALVTGQGVSWPDYIESPDPSVKDEVASGDAEGSVVQAEVDFPISTLPITLPQLLQVVSFNRIDSQALAVSKAELSVVFGEIAGEDNTADLVTILLHPKGRDILLHSPSYLLVDYRQLLLSAASQDPKFVDKIVQPSV